MRSPERTPLEQRERRDATEYESRLIERTAELNRERALLDALIEQTPVGLVVTDRAGRPTHANSEARRILGAASVEDPRLANWAQSEAYRLDGTPVAPDEWPLARALATRTRVAPERFEVVVRGGRAILEIGSGPILDEHGELAGALAVIRDVTIREREERAEREFVTNAAHQLQSPLAAIVSAIDVLQSGAKDRPERDVFLAHIDREAARLARLVRALLILARAQTGFEAPKDELVAIEPLLGEVAASLRVAEGVAVVVDCAPEVAVVTNRELLEQAVANLGENAAKHTVTGRVILSGRSVDGLVVVSVADTGPGIPASERSHVVRRFSRGNTETEGFGLGLPIVEAAAEALGGEFELDSTVGVGTVMRLRLPASATIIAAS